MLGNVRSCGALALTLLERDVGSFTPYRSARTDQPVPISGGEHMARRARKGKARKKKKANHGKRPTAR
ncbi:hypothetical protein GCM10022224_000240 [Nonomuraea antimicrobica]|uniref:Uncharacterized protein n=4 Tax=Nonomuraea TaxID=83681 RepID=A0ABP7AVR0_9ACTN